MSNPDVYGVKPNISKPKHQRERQPLPRTDLEVKFLKLVYTRIANVVKFDLAPILKEHSSGRIWLRFMFAELNNTVPSLTLRMRPFGVDCEIPYNVQVFSCDDAEKLHYGKTRIEELLRYVYSYFSTFPLECRLRLLHSKPVLIAQKRIQNLQHLCDHLSQN